MIINKSLIAYTPTSGSGSGSVTSIALTAPTGFVVSGSPITSSGTLALSFASGYALPTTIKQSNWDDAYAFATGFPVGTEGQLVKFDAFGDLEAFTPNFITNPMTSLGDMIRGNAVGLPIRLAGNTTTTKMYLSQTGDGTNSDTPIWSAISVGEVSGAVSALTGEVSTTGSGSLNVTLGTTAVTGKLLTGLSITSGAITSSDSILSAFGKVQGQINGLAGGSTYKGSWNANTNTPTIVSGTGTTGDYYIVSTAGTTTIDGVSSWDVGDWIIFSGTVWQKIDNTDSVISVNGQVGSVVLTTTDISEGTNFYYTEARVNANTNVAANTAARHNAVTLGTANGLSLSTQQLSLALASSSTTGALSSTDWATFNSKQNALTNPITGTGTTNYIPKFTGSTSLGDSIIAESSGIATIYGAGQVLASQSGAGGSTMFVSNNDTTASSLHQTRLVTQNVGSGVGRTFICAASYTPGNLTRGEFGILTEDGAQFVANFGTQMTSSDNALSIYTTSGSESVRLNTSGVSWLTGGNVGINTTSPAANLHVSGTFISTYLWTDTLGNTFWGSYNTKYGSLTWDAGKAIVFATTGNSLYLGANGSTNDAILNTSGNFGLAITPSYRLDVNGQTRISDALAIGTTPDTTLPFKIEKNINSTVGIRFQNTNTGSNSFTAVQFGSNVNGGTAFCNLVYASSGITETGVFKPSGTSLVNTGSGGLNFLAVSSSIRFFTSSGNGTLRLELVNNGFLNHYNGTAPTSSVTDGYSQYSADIVFGNAAPHFRTENGAVIKLYQETTSVGNAIFSQGGGNSVLDDSTFDGYTLRQVIKALRNQGILA